VDDCKNLSEHVALTRRYCATTPEPKIEIYRIDVALSLSISRLLTKPNVA
jgi:hypothetical protein